MTDDARRAAAPGPPRRAAGAARADAAQRAVRAGRHRPPGPALHGDRVAGRRAGGIARPATATGRERIFFPFGLGQRTTQWERGVDPMTQFTFTAGPDEYGFATRAAHGGRAAGSRSAGLARPRRPSRTWRPPGRPSMPAATTPSATWSIGSPARRPTRSATTARSSVFELRDAVLADAAGTTVSLRVIGHSRTFYDGDAVSSGCRWDGSATTASPSVLSRWCSTTASSTSTSTPPIRWRSARDPPISTRPARRPGARSIPTSSGH